MPSLPFQLHQGFVIIRCPLCCKPTLIFRDTEVLCDSLTYEQGLPHILGGEEIQQYTVAYTPPFDEFEVFKVDMPAAASTLVPANQVRSFFADVTIQDRFRMVVATLR